MTDREMLELAAKAAGLKLYEHVPGLIVTGSPETKDVDYERWDPLGDDGDALRLAVKSRIIINPDASEERTIAEYGDHDQCIEYWYGILDQGEDAATRRAIVRAASEIGRAME